LGRGITHSFQHRFEWNRAPGGQQPRQKKSLIKPTVAMARRMQRYRHKEVEMPAPQSRILESSAEPSRNYVPQMEMIPVLEIMHQAANDASAEVSRDGGLEMQFLMRAISASECAIDRAGERFGTFFAKWWHNSRRLGLACIA
jgi:hypothetical protein